MNNILINYGVRAGGGPAFLKRTRTAVGQLQTRTRTGFTYSQQQTRTRTGSQSCSSTLSYTYPCCCYDWSRWGLAGDCPPSYSNAPLGQCPGSSENWMVGTYQACWYTTAYYCERQLCYVEGVYSTSCGTCTWSGFTGWYNVSSCSASYPGCSNGALYRECQTITACAWNAYSAWSNVTSCSAVAPACSNGAFQRDCQTVYSWGDWSAYEEADICVPQSPTPSAGAVEIECVAI
jgi:hypothetical protein